MKKFTISAILFVALAIAANLQPASAVGLLYTNTVSPVAATDSPCLTKCGAAVSTSILGLVEIGDAGIQKASIAGGITKIHHVDMQTKSFLFIFCKKKTIVYGE